MRNFLLNTAAFLIWCFTLVVVSLAPIVLDQAEAIAAMFAAIVAGVSISALVLGDSF